MGHSTTKAKYQTGERLGRLGSGSPRHKIAVERKRRSSRVEEDDESKCAIGQHSSEEKAPEKTWTKASESSGTSGLTPFSATVVREGARNEENGQGKASLKGRHPGDKSGEMLSTLQLLCAPRI